MTKFSGPLLHTDRSSAADRDWFSNAPSFMDTDFVQLMDDFIMVANDQTNDWTVVKDTSATVAVLADTVNGILRLTSAATTDNDGASIQGNEVFLPATGVTIWFEARIRASDADQHDGFIGLCENFATNPEACLTASNRIGFQINDEDASILCKSEVADTEASTDSGVDQADATFNVVGFKINGTSSIEFYVDRKLVATHTSVPATELTPAFFNLSGNATGTHTADVDYISVVATRGAVTAWS
jgi:hypothetical protein